MNKISTYLHFLILLLFIATAAQAQTSISGKITDAANGDGLAGVNILVKGKVLGTVTDINGNFKLSVGDAPPFTLQISYIGYTTQEFVVSNAAMSNIDIKMQEQTMLGQEVVISASRVEESILESPVSIEKMDILAVQSTASDNYYKGIAALKGVDVTSSSINFQIINTRGFANTGNTRFVQLTDGMDTQAPALNFPIGNLNGPSELDVESVELIPGASSALYGPNAFNGILLVNSKSPFEYQGVSAFSKVGVNHVGGGEKSGHDAAPLYEGALRYAKSFNNKFAFKVNLAYSKAEDWHGTSDVDREIARTPEGFSSNPGSDRLHYMGDEASINLAIFPLSANWNVLARSAVFEPGVSAQAYANAGDLPSNVVSVTPYKEVDLIDYGAENKKASVGLFYRLNDRMELSYLFNGGWGTSIYTGAQRYSLNNFGIMQHRLQLRGDNFYVRAYTTRENSGDSYITEFLAKRVNDLAAARVNPNFDVSSALGVYGIEYLRYLYNAGYQPGEVNTLSDAERIQVQQAGHAYARGVFNDQFTLDPNSKEFQDIKKQALIGVVPRGPGFNDKTNLYHAEGQYDFKNEIDFMELQVGASYRLYELNSGGTIFDDADAPITIAEQGIYTQFGKWIGERKVKLSGSVRYDKNQNFKGRVNPRLSAVWKVKENHNLRASFQTGFRIPTTQGQHIDLSIISARLLGGLPQYAEKYNLTELSSTGVPLGYEGFSVQNYGTAVFNQGATPAAIFNPANIALLTPVTTFNPVKPEQVKSFEIGYKTLIQNKLMIDAGYYYNIYDDFISQIRVRKATAFTEATAPSPELVGTPNYATILNGTDLNTFQIYTNIDQTVTSQGTAIGLTYNLSRGYTISANHSWNVLNDVPENFLAEYNTPEHKVNVSFSNRKLTDIIGFNVAMRWQSEFEWQSSFVAPAFGMVPAYTTVDAQMSFKLPNIKSMLKVGASNLMNTYYIQSLGGPNIGGIYYVSLTFDELMN
jgi:iron complex outermembrane recepter protein